MATYSNRTSNFSANLSRDIKAVLYKNDHVRNIFSSTNVRRDFISSLREDSNLVRQKIGGVIEPACERLTKARQELATWTSQGAFLILVIFRIFPILGIFRIF